MGEVSVTGFQTYNRSSFSAAVRNVVLEDDPGWIGGFMQFVDAGLTGINLTLSATMLAANTGSLSGGARARAALNTSANAAKGGQTVGKNVFTVTKERVALPKGAKIPSEFIQNPYRGSSYGILKNGKFVEKLRIDSPTLPGFKGPNQNHFHLNNGGHIFDATKWPWWY